MTIYEFVQLLARIESRCTGPVLAAVCRLHEAGQRATVTDIARSSQLDSRTVKKVLEEAIPLRLIVLASQGSRIWYEPGPVILGEHFEAKPEQPCLTENRVPLYVKSRVSPELRQAVVERDGGRCLKCGGRDRLAADHIFPELFGGETTLDNLQTLCLACNSAKGTKIIDYTQLTSRQTQ